MRLRLRGFAFIGVVGALALASAPGAYATLELRLSDSAGGAPVDVFDGCGPGCVSYNGAVGGWNINITSGTSADGQSPIMDLNSIDHHNASKTASVLTIELSDNGFATTAPQFSLNIGGTVGPNGTLTAALFGATSDTKFDLSNQIGTTMTFTNPPTATHFSEGETGNAGTVYPYALTEVATITFGKRVGQASFDFSIDAIPEPTGVVLLGGVLLATVGAIRRKARRA